MGASQSKCLLVAAVLVAVAASAAFGQTRVVLTADAVANFEQRPSAGTVVNTFATANQPLYWGFGYEVVRRHIGFGGLYTANFQRSSATDWWLDWYGEAIYVSYHLFRYNRLIDPFVSLGLGSAGRVWLGPESPAGYTNGKLLLSIFPVLSAGLGLNLDVLYLSGKLSYLPAVSPPPVSPYNNVPIGHFLFAASVGFALGR